MKIIKQTVQISSCYQILSGTSPSQPFLIEHCCLMTPGNEWDMEVKCRPISHGAQCVSNQRNNWRSLMVVYPEAKVQLKHNDIEVTLPSLQEDEEITAFGRFYTAATTNSKLQYSSKILKHLCLFPLPQC